jgi:uncharacterized protein
MTELTEQALEMKRAYQREWRKKNREHIRKYHSEWKKKNRDKSKEAEIRYWNKKAAELETE